MTTLFSLLKQNIKNIGGKIIGRKIVVFSVDDFGNVRLHSANARETLRQKGYTVHNRFDNYDALETKEDLEQLFEVLTSVKDKNNRPACFTPFAVPCNIDFERMRATGYETYYYEILPRTFEKLASIDPRSYEHTWELWQQGMTENLLAPQFHGREHFNLTLFNQLLEHRNQQLMDVLETRSLPSLHHHGKISFTAAFAYEAFSTLQHFDPIIKDGVKRFREVFGYSPVHFCPPAAADHPVIHHSLKEAGINFIDTARFKKIETEENKFKYKYFYTGKKNVLGQTFLVRNIVFEPAAIQPQQGVASALKQIETAFRWKKPAIISSHRVNFAGHIDPKNRGKGLAGLLILLRKIVDRWPDVEFMSVEELDHLIDPGK